MKLKRSILALATIFILSHYGKAATTVSLSSSTYTQNFDGLGTSSGTFSLTGWGVTAAGGGGTTVNYGTLSGTTTTQAASSGTPATGGIYNWGNGTTPSDRALGFMTSGTYASPNAIVFGFTNNLGSTITGLSLGFDYERYRLNTAAASVVFSTSTSGTSWTDNTSGNSGAFTTGASAYNFSSAAVVSKSGISLTGLSIAAGSSYYFQWNFLTVGSNSQGIGLDNFTLSATSAPPTVGNFWDGNGSVAGGGGNGTWASGGSTFATDILGANGGLTQGSGTIVFGGTAGAVGVSGTVSADSGVTFGTTGYALTGGAVNLGGASSSVNSITTDPGVTSTIASNLTGSNGLTKAGSGTLTLSGSNSLSGSVSVSAGTLELAAAGALGSATSVSMGGTLLLSGAEGNRINNTAAVSVTSGGLFNLNGLSETIGALNLTSGVSAATVSTGAGTLTVGGNIAATGGTSNAAAITGNLDLGGAIRTITVTNGTATTDLDLGATVISNGGIILSGSTSATRTDISGASTFAGGATLNSGLLVLGSSSNGTPASFTTGPLGTGTVTLAGGTLQALTSSRTLNNAVQVAGNFATAGTQTLVLAGPVDLNGTTRTLDLVSGLTLSGAISNGGLIKTGVGQLTLSGSNSYSDVTRVSAGTLLTGASNTLPTGTAVTVGTSGATSNPGLLNLNGTSQTIASLTLLGGNTSAANSGSVTIGSGGILTVNGTVTYETGSNDRYPSAIKEGTLNLGGATRTFAVYDNNNEASDLDVASVIDNGSINKTQDGILRLSGANTLGGGVTVGAGTLALNNVNALQNSTLNTGTSGTQLVTFAVAGNNTYNLGGLAGSDPLAIGANTISVGANGADTSFSAVISGTGGSLNKTGAGILTLGATNTYTGTTTINAGILAVNGSLASGSAVTVNSGGTLGGSGTVNGTVSVKSGGIVGSGNSPGVLTTGATTFESGSVFSWELNSDVDRNGTLPDGTRGTNYDGLTATSLSVASGAIFRVVLTGTASSDLSSNFWNTNQTWNDIFSVSGSTTNAALDKLFNTLQVFNGSNNITTASALQGSFSFTNSSLTWTAVPEPSSALAGLLLGAGLLRRRRSA